MFFWREIQIPLENIFSATNFKNIKDDYRGKITEISEKVQKGVCSGSTAVKVEDWDDFEV